MNNQFRSRHPRRNSGKNVRLLITRPRLEKHIPKDGSKYDVLSEQRDERKGENVYIGPIGPCLDGDKEFIKVANGKVSRKKPSFA